MQKGKEQRPKACKSHKEVKERLKISEKRRNKERKRKAQTEERIVYLTEKYTGGKPWCVRRVNKTSFWSLSCPAQGL